MTIIQAFKPLFKLCAFIAHALFRCQPGAFTRRFPFVMVALTRVDQDLGHQTRALTGTQAKVRPRPCIPEPIISCPLSGSRSCDTSSVSADDITGIPLSLPRHLMKYVTRHGGPRRGPRSHPAST
jgi:hypothetical protein